MYMSQIKQQKTLKYIFYQRAYGILRHPKYKTDFKNITELRYYLLNLWIIQNKKCYYTGINMKLKGYHTNNLAFTVDRINPKKGYTKGNMVLCCAIINRIKQDLTIDELKKYVNMIK